MRCFIYLQHNSNYLFKRIAALITARLVSTSNMFLRNSALPLRSSIGRAAFTTAAPTDFNNEKFSVSSLIFFPINKSEASLQILGIGATAPITIQEPVQKLPSEVKLTLTEATDIEEASLNPNFS